MVSGVYGLIASDVTDDEVCALLAQGLDETGGALVGVGDFFELTDLTGEQVFVGEDVEEDGRFAVLLLVIGCSFHVV